MLHATQHQRLCSAKDTHGCDILDITQNSAAGLKCTAKLVTKTVVDPGITKVSGNFVENYKQSLSIPISLGLKSWSTVEGLYDMMRIQT